MLRFSKSHLASLLKWPLQSDGGLDQCFLGLRGEQNTFDFEAGEREGGHLENNSKCARNLPWFMSSFVVMRCILLVFLCS